MKDVNGITILIEIHSSKNVKNLNELYYKIIKNIQFYIKDFKDGGSKNLTVNCPNQNIDNIFTCKGDLSPYPLGKYILEYNDLCGSNKTVDDFYIRNKNYQRIISISPKYININENKKAITVNLEYKNEFKEKPFKLSLINKDSMTTVINGIFENLNINGKNVNFDIPPEVISDMKAGKYFIELFFDNQENNFVSSEVIIFYERLSLYEKRQRLPQADNLVKIGIIFNTEVILDRISSISYNNNNFNYYIHEEHPNILIINTSNIDLNITGEYIFKIYEKNFEDEPLIYILEIVETQLNYTIFNHFYYTKTKEGKSFITISASKDVIAMKKLRKTHQRIPLWLWCS